MKPTVAVITLTLCFAAGSLFAQTYKVSDHPALAAELHKSATATANAMANPAFGKPEDQIPGQSDTLYVLALQELQTQKARSALAIAVHTTMTKEADTQRVDKQVGSPTTSDGSTSLAQKPGIPALLGFAIENGAVAEDVTGTVLTLRSSPYALVAAFKGDTAETYSNYGGYSRLGVSASFNVTSTSDPLQDVSRKQLANWSAKFRLFGDLSARSKAAEKLFNDTLSSQAANLENKVTLAMQLAFPTSAAPLEVSRRKFNKDAAEKVKAYVDAHPLATPNQMTDAERTDRTSGIEAVLVQVFEQDFAEPTFESPELVAALEEYRVASEAFIKQSDVFQQALKDLAAQQSASIIYTDQQQTGNSNYSNVAFAYAGTPSGFGKATKDGKGSLTINLSTSFYHHPDATKNQKSWRDSAAAIDFTQKLGRSPFLRDAADLSPVALCFSGRYQRLTENEHTSGKKADIAEASLKLEIPVGAGISFPISGTFANAGQSTNSTYARGNFGLSFDLDKLAALTRH